MKTRKQNILAITLFCLAMLIGFLLPSCGTVRTHAGIEHEWGYDFDQGRPVNSYHKPPKKQKKHKKHKHHHDNGNHNGWYK